MGSYTHRRLTELEDAAAAYGHGDLMASRFASTALEAEATGLAHHHLRPGARQPFGHRHERAEEVYVVLGGSGRIALDDRVIEVADRDAVRIAPGVTRCVEAGPDGLELLAFGPRHEGDGELIPGWWPEAAEG
jgi:mannose-6-phosphate isomerase-like protein (cupin superfamily)